MLVDASPLIYQVWNSPQAKFTTKAGELTGLRYGFFRSIRSYAQATQADKVVVVFDAPGQVKKAEGIATYKANRVTTQAVVDMYSQVPKLKEALAKTGWSTVEAVGYEADDVIGTLTRKLIEQGHQVTIISTDNDMAQLIALGAEIFMPSKKDAKAYKKDSAWVWENFGVDPRGLLLWRAIEGDTSDNVAGLNLDRSSKATIKQEINTLAGSITRPLDPDDLIDEDSDLGLFEATLRSNYSLMHLHDAVGIEITKGSADEQALLELFEQLEFKSLVPYAKEIARGNHRITVTV